MRDIVDGLVTWRARGLAVAVATVVESVGSGPRPVGASMAVASNDEILGAITGGCVEAAVVDLARATLADGVARRETFGIVADADLSLAPGLQCGGTVEVLIHRPDDAVLHAYAAALGARRPVTLVTVIDGDDAGRQELITAPGTATAAHVEMAADGTRRFVDPAPVPASLVIIGATDHAAALAEIGRVLGFHVTVCDPRPLFATAARLPAAHDVVVGWPHRLLPRLPLDERSAVCVLSHDAKVDVPAIRAALATPVGYLGVMGSRATHAARLRRLRSEGVGEADLRRISGPIGLDLGGTTAAETALAIAAEIVAHRHGGTGRPLREIRGPIHRAAAVSECATPTR